MSYTYSTWKSALAQLGVYSESNADFVAILPSVIDYAEDRIYRELDLLSTRVRDSSSNLSANSRNFTLPTSQGVFRTVESINVITPVGATTSNGTRNQLTRVQKRVIDYLYPSEVASAATAFPSAFAMVSNTLVIMGPAPGAAFNVEVIGTIQPNALSASNTTTYLTTYLPDLFMAASMVFLSGFQKNFGSQADTPQQAVSWEAQYQTLLQSAMAQNQRAQFNLAMSMPKGAAA